jgi:hypothetical protein
VATIGIMQTIECHINKRVLPTDSGVPIPALTFYRSFELMRLRGSTTY